MQGERIRIRGLVQGVGFRPTVWRIASRTGVLGQVTNDGEGVLIEAWGSADALDRLCHGIRAECPPLARIEALERTPLDTAAPPGGGFVIAASLAGGARTAIVADAATCPACLAEIRDPGDRRYRYPFTNCTHCGPRLSIVRGIPYDRANTSMAAFTQCARCQAEYQDPTDRRFHAQPNACPQCGPRVWLVGADGAEQQPQQYAARDAIALGAALMAQGHIIAIKGIGGFHLACDASNDAAVDKLRRRKRRYDKPFALMAADIETVERFIELDPDARAQLAGPAAPIVLADRRSDAPPLAAALAPGQSMLGFMLPYSPLHHILLADWHDHRPGTPLVMTSGNLSDEPQCTDNLDAGERLGQIADAWLLHDREIVNRVDDSVLQMNLKQPHLLRRARGYAPHPIPLPPGFADAPPLLALGAELKNTFCLLHNAQAVVSQHLGDLEDARTSDAWEQTLALYQRLFQHQPAAVVVDLHPDYRSTRFGSRWALERGLDVIEVQHHHAHIASTMADNAWPMDAGPVLGIALDGLGMGTDGTLWGGEFLHVEYQRFERLAHLPAVPLPGGTRALLEPWRNTWAQLCMQLGWDSVNQHWAGLELVQWLRGKPLQVLTQMQARGINSPLSSSCGRLFDAVAGALGVRRDHISYEGQAAIELEHLAGQACEEQFAYPFARQDAVIDTAPMWQSLLDDLDNGVEAARISARFHAGLAEMIVATAAHFAEQRALDCVALSGGVFQNRRLFSSVAEGLVERGLRVLGQHQVPCNDGGIALGQAVIGASRLLNF